MSRTYLRTYGDLSNPGIIGYIWSLYLYFGNKKRDNTVYFFNCVSLQQYTDQIKAKILDSFYTAISEGKRLYLIREGKLFRIISKDTSMQFATRQSAPMSITYWEITELRSKIKNFIQSGRIQTLKCRRSSGEKVQKSPFLQILEESYVSVHKMKNVKLVNLVLEQNSSDFGMCKEWLKRNLICIFWRKKTFKVLVKQKVCA